jgi:endo-1,4-beta-D-glucanase Y
MIDVRRVIAGAALPTLLALVACSGNPPSTPGTLAGGSAGNAPAVGGAQAGISQGGASGGPVAIGGGGSAGSGGGPTSSAGSTTTLEQPGAKRPFPQRDFGKFCGRPVAADDGAALAAYQTWKTVTVTADGAGGFLRVKKPDSGAIIGSTASEGIGYGMILAAYFGDQPVFDGLWRYEQLHLDDNGLMNWDIGPDGMTSPGGMGAATDGDVDMAWALVMADRQWGGQGALAKPYLEYAKELIGLIWKHEVDHKRGEMLMAGDKWGDVDITNPSYFAPAYFRVFGKVTGQTENWNKVIDANYAILAKSLNAASGNANNGLAPAWCDSSGKPVEAFAGAPTHFQNDATRVPFRVGQDYCYFGEPRAKQYLALINSFYSGVGVANIVDGYNLDGTPRPERAVGGLQAASFVGPAGVAGMSDSAYQALVDQAYAALATQGLTAGTIYYQKSWTALSLLMLTGNFVDLTAE